SDPAKTASPANRPKLSDVFRIHLIELTDGTVVYDPRIPSTVPMQLDQINTSLDVQPDAPGSYKIATRLTREPAFRMKVGGNLNLDTFDAKDILLEMKADLSQEQLSYLPPQLQELIHKYELRGVMMARLSGSVPIMQPLNGRLYADLS